MKRFDNISISDLNENERSDVIGLAIRVLASRMRKGRQIKSMKDASDYLQLTIGERSTECFGVIFVDQRHRVISSEILFFGTIDGAAVYPRVVVERALGHNAAGVILYHNHPSGVAEPSMADKAITKRLRDALNLIDVRVIDHLVICAGESCSFANRGWL